MNPRFKLHESFIKNKRDNNISNHFNLEKHTPTSYTIKIVGQGRGKEQTSTSRRILDPLVRHYSTQGLEPKIVTTIEIID